MKQYSVFGDIIDYTFLNYEGFTRWRDYVRVLKYNNSLSLFFNLPMSYL